MTDNGKERVEAIKSMLASLKMLELADIIEFAQCELLNKKIGHKRPRLASVHIEEDGSTSDEEEEDEEEEDEEEDDEEEEYEDSEGENAKKRKESDEEESELE